MIEYLPYGETLYDEAATVDKTEFRFTSKEQDAETGLYYHGARYRDAKTGVWLSCDPILNKYLQGKPNEGVYNYINLNLYAYAAVNPIRFSDPDGNKFRDKVETAGVFIKRFALTSFLLLQRNTWGNPGHVSAEKLNEMEPIPPSKSKVEDYADVAAWFAEPVVAYGMLKLPTMRSGKGVSVEASAGPKVYSVAKYKPWPENGGFLGNYRAAGRFNRQDVFTRIGDLDGTYVSPEGTSFNSRGLPSSYPNKTETVWKVLEPIDYEAGIAAPWKDSPGMGIQYKLRETVENLWKAGKIQPVVKPK